MAITYGAPEDDGVSHSLKCYITQELDGQTVTVVGYMTGETNLSLRSLWNSPFEGDSIGNANFVDKGASIAQSQTEATSKTKANSTQVWEGMEPPEVTMQLKLIAYTNANNEVDAAIQALMKMASPELLNTIPISSDQLGGRVPSSATFNIGRKFISTMRISEVSYDLNAPKTKGGNFAYNTVSITAAPKQMINKSEIASKFK